MAEKGSGVKLVLRIDTQEEDVFCVATDEYDPPGLYTGHHGSFKRWNKDGSLVTSTQLPVQGEVTCISSTPMKLAVSIDTTLFLYDPKNLATPTESCSHNKDEINQICVNRSDSFLLSSDDSGEVQVLDVGTGRLKPYRSLCKHSNICSAVAFNPLKHWEAISGGLDCRIMLWDFSRGKSLDTLNVQEALPDSDEPTTYLINPPMVHALCWVGRLPLVAVGLGNGLIVLCSVTGRKIKLVCSRRFHTKGVASVTCLELVEHGTTTYVIVSGGNDGKLVWTKLIKDTENTKGSVDSYMLSEEPLAIYGHGSKVNWITSVSGWGQNIVGVADQTGIVSLYSITL